MFSRFLFLTLQNNFFFTVSQKYYGNRLLFRLFLFFPKNKKNNQNFLGHGNNRKYTENCHFFHNFFRQNKKITLYRCKALNHPFEINAILCNGHSECEGDIDENKNRCEVSLLSLIIVLAVDFVIISLATGTVYILGQ